MAQEERMSEKGLVNEALCKVLAHNICVLIQAMHALNVRPIFRSEIQAEPKMAARGDF
jgi:hypothetical protein